MKNKEKIKLLNTVEDLIIELGGVEEIDLLRIGITIFECENPTHETVVKFKNHLRLIQNEKELNSHYGK